MSWVRSVQLPCSHLDILLSQQMLDAIKTLLMTISSFSKTVNQCILSSTVQLLQNSQLLSPELWPCNSRELNSTDYMFLGVIQQQEHELQLRRRNKLSLAEVWQCGKTAFEQKMQLLYPCVLPVVHKQ